VLTQYIRLLPVVALALSFAAPARADAPFSFDRAFGRLPKNVVPTDYRIAVVPDAKALTLTGTESIALKVRSATDTIQFNSLNERLSNVTFDDKPVAKTVSSNDTQLTTITLAAPAAPGKHTLRFAYTGKIETGPLGLFAQPYAKPGGGAGVMLSTQFESTDARRMFPCWDEPAFRATYTLSVTVPAAWATVSNMPVAGRVVHGDVATTTFARTPKMPSYLVEFSAGDLAEISATSGGTAFNVWAVRGQEQSGAYALANAQQILADYDDYFDYKFPLPKLDSIAVPGGFQGAMENWGAITYNDQTLLVTPSSTLPARQEVFSIQAHEMAHQWNGDLVTMGWWDDLWLNESFATWRSAQETALRNPTWKWLEAQDADKERAMAADARISSHPIIVHITDELQAETAFDSDITYAKGAAFLRMLEAYLSPDTFRAGVRRYIKARAFSNATGPDLWNALNAASGKDVAKIAANWTTQAGFPVISETATCDGAGNRTISLAQHRFLMRGSDPANERWSIPVDVKASAHAAPVPLLLETDGQTAPAGRCGDPLILNPDAIGFYRVDYDPVTLAANTKAFGTIDSSDRIAMLDDQWALVEANQAPLSSYLALASSMGDDLDGRAWEQISEALGTIEYDERGTPGYAAFTAYARSVIKPVADRLGWDAKPDDSPVTQELRRSLIADLGAWGDPGVVAEAQKRFTAFLADPASLKPDDQSTVLNIVAINADAPTYAKLLDIAKGAKNETELRRYFGALANVRNPQLAAETVKLALSPAIPPQAAPERIQLIGQLADYNPQLSWQTLSTNIKTLVDPFGPMVGPQIIAEYIAPGYWNAVPLDVLEAWVKAHTSPDLAPMVARGMESARFRVSLKTALLPAADAYVADHHSISSR
jgi:aminopeptidase N